MEQQNGINVMVTEVKLRGKGFVTRLRDLQVQSISVAQPSPGSAAHGPSGRHGRLELIAFSCSRTHSEGGDAPSAKSGIVPSDAVVDGACDAPAGRVALRVERAVYVSWRVSGGRGRRSLSPTAPRAFPRALYKSISPGGRDRRHCRSTQVTVDESTTR